MFLSDNFQPQHDLTAIIGLSGEIIGTVVLSLEREVAISATEALLGERPSSIDADVVDATGELSNIVAGGAKAQMSQYELSLALPTVIVGRSHVVTFESDVRPICIPFKCDWGNLTLEVGFTSGRD